MILNQPSLRAAIVTALIGVAGAAPTAYAQNPCAPKNPCAAKNTCAPAPKVDPKLVTRPAGTQLAGGHQADLVAFGKQLFSDTKLSSNGMSCASCHTGNAAFAQTFAQPYPHFVQMAGDRSGLKKVALDEMVQLCMVVPMAAKPLPWGSRELAALTSYTAEVQKTFKPAAAAATAATAKNPCAPNPCAAKR